MLTKILTFLVSNLAHLGSCVKMLQKYKPRASQARLLVFS